MKYAKEVFQSRELLAYLTLKEIKGRYKRTFLGQLWSLLNPLAAMLIYTFVFGFILKLTPKPGDPSGLDIFALWLLCGLIPWVFLATTISQGMQSLVLNANLIQKVYFSRIVLPLSAAGAAGFTWLFEMFVLIIALSIFGAFVLPWIPYLVFVMLLLALFAIGLSLMLAVANVVFRDTEHFVGILLQIWMYLTPIIYPNEVVEAASNGLGGILGTNLTVLGFYQWNPMVHFVNVFRALMYDNRWPDPNELLICAIWALAIFIVGVLVFRRNESKLAEML
ncbi:MAG: ABC transporter permease [Cryobacterium sp.]|nr:ABC transporter permease [Cryobacterium sp.]